MQRLKKTFATLHANYARKRSLFVARVNDKGKRGRLSFYRHGRQVIQELDELMKEITSALDQRKKVFRDPEKRKAVKVKIKRAKILYKDLVYTTRSHWLLWVEVIGGALLFAFFLRAFCFGVYHSPSGSMEPTVLVGDHLVVNKILYHLKKPKPGDVVLFDSLGTEYDSSSKFKYFWQKHIGVSIPFLNLKEGASNFVRRIVAIPNDVIEGKVEDGKPVLYRNGQKINEYYVNTYPLLAMHKKIGFFESERVGLFHIPDFLKSKYKLVLYSYDPNKDFYDQPFYKIDCRNVLRVPGSVDIQCSVPCTPSVNDQGKVIDTFGPYKIPAGKYWVMGDNRKNSVDSRVWHFVDRKFIRGKVRFIIWSVDTEEEYWMFECVKHPLRFFNKLVRWNRFFKKIK